MKKLLLTMLVVLCAAKVASAETINFVVDGICYQINTTNAHIATIVPGSYAGIDYASTLSGDLVIPSEVVNNGITYSVHSVNQSAFANCNNITSISLPNSLQILWYGAFKNCTSLTSLTIPASVTQIHGDGVNGLYGPTYGCDNLTTLVVEEGNPKYDSRDNCNAIIETATNKLLYACKGTTVPATVTTIGKSAFREITITSLVVPENVTKVEDYAFLGSTLKDITFEGVKTIDMFVFNNCQSLETVTLPASLESIGTGSFIDCVALADVYAYPAGGSVTLGDVIWAGVDQPNCNLHVYPADFDYYSTADQWKEFNVIDDLGVSIPDVYILGEVGTQTWAPNAGTKMEYNAETGLYTAAIECIDADQNGYDYFSFTTELAEYNDQGSWDYIAPFRFGAVSNDDFLVSDDLLGTELSLEPGGDAFKIPAGEYNLSLNYADMKLVITKKAEGKLGDANCDGKVDVNDVTTVINYILKKNPSPFSYDNANVNGDDTVSVMDVTLIIDMILHPSNY